MRRLALLLSVALVVFAGVEIELPFYETRPGGAHAVEPLIELGEGDDELNGELRLLTVIQATPNVFETLVAWADPDRDLTPADQRVPEGVELDAYRKLQAEQFANSFTTAIGVAARAAGYDVTVSTMAVVAQVMPTGPSQDLLQPGDIVTAIDDTPVTTGNELVAELQQRGLDDDVVLELTRDDEPGVTVTVTLRALDELDGRAGLGVVIETLNRAVELPFDASLNETNIIGSSAGMMVALTATDLLLDEDLTRGRIIAGTGTIDGAGNVGRIGGIEQKMEAAIDSEAELILVPLEQLGAAIEAVDGRAEVVGVATLDEALEALRAP